MDRVGTKIHHHLVHVSRVGDNGDALARRELRAHLDVVGQGCTHKLEGLLHTGMHIHRFRLAARGAAVAQDLIDQRPRAMRSLHDIGDMPAHNRTVGRRCERHL